MLVFFGTLNSRKVRVESGETLCLPARLRKYYPSWENIVKRAPASPLDHVRDKLKVVR